ncbi:tetratricopeptide repeat protein, partial [Clostridium saudiense]|nr:tetratricopeptide repeat protein [Clostridium saudiense]
MLSYHYGIGVLFDESKNYLEAIKYYQKAIKIDNNYDKAYFFLA